ncbi:MAG: hypothetical protein WBG86_03225, partial [Polyangiales bacterium]
MNDFTNFALQMTLPPNPVRALDRSFTAAQQRGMDFFDGSTGQFSDGVTFGGNAFTCDGCHSLSPDEGFFGTGKLASFEGETQIFKIPHLRNLYQKVGMFGMPNVDFHLPGSASHTGDQVRGTGFLHDGATDTLFRFFTSVVFQNPGLLFNDSGVGFIGGNPQRRDVEAAMLAFDSDLAPIVGQQVTLNFSNFADVSSRLDLLEQRAGTPFESAILGGLTTECDLVAHGQRDFRPRAALYDPATDSYIFDSRAETPVSAADMRADSQASLQATTFTCVPPGSGERLGHDRDLDGVWNRDEALAFTDSANAGSVPGGCSDGVDNDADGLIDMADPGCEDSSSNVENPQCSDGYDNDADGLIDMADDECDAPHTDNEGGASGDCRAGPTGPIHGGTLLLWVVALALGTRYKRKTPV